MKHKSCVINKAVFFLNVLLNIKFYWLVTCPGLKEYIGANPSLASEFLTTSLRSKFYDVSSSNSEHEDANVADEFYDALSADSSDDSSDDDSDNKEEVKDKVCLLSASSLL